MSEALFLHSPSELAQVDKRDPFNRVMLYGVIPWCDLKNHLKRVTRVYVWSQSNHDFGFLRKRLSTW